MRYTRTMLIAELQSINPDGDQVRMQEKARGYATLYHVTGDKGYAWLYHWSNYCAHSALDEDIPSIKYLWDGLLHMQDIALMKLFLNQGFCNAHRITRETLRETLVPHLTDEALTYRLMEYIGINISNPHLLRKNFEGTCLEERIRTICYWYEEGLIDKAAMVQMVKDKGQGPRTKEVEVYL